MNFKKQTLPNGLTIITAPIKDAPSVTVFVMVKTGSKYETKEISGLSHFLEHMCFKGTTKRPKTIDISTELDSIGSQTNAFTSQEFTGYFAKAHPSHFDKILDVVSDMYNNPVFNPKEIENEKGVIIEEMNMYYDMPMWKVQSVFMEALYGEQPAGWDIIGTKENINRITRQDFIDYRKKHYVAGATTVVIAGNFDESTVIKKIEELFYQMSTDKKSDKLKTIENQTEPNIKIQQRETDQTHILVGVRTFGSNDKRNTILKVLNAVLGGGMSGRLWQKLRTEMGSSYYVNSDADKYTDHGYLYVAVGIDGKRIEEVVSAILNELKRFKTEIVSEKELQKAKDYLVGNTYLGLESSSSLAEFYAIQDVLGNEIFTPDEFATKIQTVTALEVQKLAQEILVDKGLNMAIVGNIKDQNSLKQIFHF